MIAGYSGCEIDHIFRGSEQRLRADIARVARQPPDLQRRIAMMVAIIVRSPADRSRPAATYARKPSDFPDRKTRSRACIGEASIRSVRRSTIDTPPSSNEKSAPSRCNRRSTVSMAFVFGASSDRGDEKSAGPRKALQRLPQTSQRNQFAAAERVQRVDQHQIEVPMKLQMLEPVIKEQQAHIRSIEQLLADGEPIGSDASGNTSRTMQSCASSPVSDTCRRSSSCSNQTFSRTIAPMPAHEQARLGTAKIPQKFDGGGSLSRPSGGNVPDAHDGTGNRRARFCLLRRSACAAHFPEQR